MGQKCIDLFGNLIN